MFTVYMLLGFLAVKGAAMMWEAVWRARHPECVAALESLRRARDI